MPHGTRHGFVRGSVLSRITRPTDLDFIPERSGILWIRDMENFLHILCIRDLSADFGRLFNLVRGLKFFEFYWNSFNVYLSRLKDKIDTRPSCSHYQSDIIINAKNICLFCE